MGHVGAGEQERVQIHLRHIERVRAEKSDRDHPLTGRVEGVRGAAGLDIDVNRAKTLGEGVARDLSVAVLEAGRISESQSILSRSGGRSLANQQYIVHKNTHTFVRYRLNPVVVKLCGIDRMECRAPVWGVDGRRVESEAEKLRSHYRVNDQGSCLPSWSSFLTLENTCLQVDREWLIRDDGIRHFIGRKRLPCAHRVLGQLHTID